MSFDGLKYTREALMEELALVERHARDGSAVDAGCGCIEEKHLLLVAGLGSEGVVLATKQEEKQFYSELADLARNLRKKVLDSDFNMHGVMRETMKKKHPLPLHSPNPRSYLPHGLTQCEKTHPKVLHELSACIKKLEPKERSGEIESAVAVCRASIPCP